MSQASVSCPSCGEAYRCSDIIRHLNSEHPEEAWSLLDGLMQSSSSFRGYLRHNKRTRRKPNTTEPDKPPFRGPGSVYLISKRGTYVRDGYCSECGKMRKGLMRYRESNYGPVLICDTCKYEVFLRVGRTGSDAHFSAYEGGSFSPK